MHRCAVIRLLTWSDLIGPRRRQSELDCLHGCAVQIVQPEPSRICEIQPRQRLLRCHIREGHEASIRCKSTLNIVFPVVDTCRQINAIEHIKGGVEIGQYILERVDNVHVTGSDKTYDMIVWGTTDKTKKIGEPKFTKEFTSELGCVTPVSTIVE
jgi:hypothetical protein